MTPRMLDVRGSRNLRDLGGYRTANGRRVRHGRLYRGGHPGELCETGIAEFAALGIGAIVDLRTTEERAHIPYPAASIAVARYWARDYALSQGDIVAMLRDPATTAEAMRARMLGNYRRMVDEQHEGIAATLRFLAEGRTPVLVNCTAGKDRTGVVTAVTLAALGVVRDDIRRDYAHTEAVLPADSQLFAYDRDGPFGYMLDVAPAVMRVMMGADPANIDAMFDDLAGRFGSVENYLCEAHGIDAAALGTLRETMLEV